MKKTYSIKCNKYRKIKNPEVSYILDKTFVLSIICGERGSNDEKIFQLRY